MKQILALTGALVMTVACASAPPPDGGESTGSPTSACDAGKAQSLVGRPATSELAAEAQRLSGARTVRWLRPGQIVTMEYLAERLNIQVDDQNKVIAIRCG